MGRLDYWIEEYPCKAATVFPSDTFAEPGVYEGEIEITFSGGGVQTLFDLIKFNVRGDFD